MGVPLLPYIHCCITILCEWAWLSYDWTTHLVEGRRHLSTVPTNAFRIPIKTCSTNLRRNFYGFLLITAFLRIFNSNYYFNVDFAVGKWTLVTSVPRVRWRLLRLLFSLVYLFTAVFIYIYMYIYFQESSPSFVLIVIAKQTAQIRNVLPNGQLKENKRVRPTQY